MAGYLLDTNHLSHAIRRVSPFRDRIRQSHRQGSRFGICWPVLCELEAGICSSARPEAYRRTLRALLKEIRIWPVDWDIIRLYGELFNRTQAEGKALSHVDLVLAAMADNLNVTLLTTDGDFAATPEVRTENWLHHSKP